MFHNAVSSILDTDLYKLTMQQAILERFPTAGAEYVFSNRRPEDFQKLTDNQREEFLARLGYEIETMATLSLQDDERLFLDGLPYLKPGYKEYLKNYRFNPNEIKIYFEENNLNLRISGPWHKTVLWEVPLLATISEVYFKLFNTWGANRDWIIPQAEQIRKKGQALADAGCKFSDFGTRRRRSREVQELIDRELAEFQPHFVGTSNVLNAMLHGLRPIGTMAHEWIMGISALLGLRHANRFALYEWAEVYNADLGIALTDTFGTGIFFGDFDLRLSKMYDGVRQDSGIPENFITKAILHYERMRIAPATKSIIFSDSLNVEKAIELQRLCENRIGCSFGIGTNLTNDFPDGHALNIVIKLAKINGVDVVKLSDSPGKEIGGRDALRVAKYIFSNTPLDKRD